MIKKKRTSKQLRADINRIKLEGKTLKQQMKVIANQYSKMGRSIPKKLQENRATKRDILGYMRTLITVLDNKIERQDLRSNKDFNNTLNELNAIQKLRHKIISESLQGYDKQFVKEFLGGKVAILGRNSSTSVVNTNLYDMDRIIRLSKRNRVSPIAFMKEEIKALKKSIQDFKNDSPKEYILEQMTKILESQGYKLTNKNLKDVENNLNKIDWLGGLRIIKGMEARIESKAYESYKGDWDLYGNRKLMEIILDDIKRGSHNNMVQHVRLID